MNESQCLDRSINQSISIYMPINLHISVYQSISIYLLNHLLINLMDHLVRWLARGDIADENVKAKVILGLDHIFSFVSAQFSK